MPLLIKAHNDLPFIPIRFIVTRADEFKLDWRQPFSESNFDDSRAQQFIGQLIARLAKAIPGKNVEVSDILLIDNQSEFQTDKIVNFIQHKNSAQSANYLHSHKILYFIKNINQIKSYFQLYLSDKIKTIEELLKTAQANNHNFQETLRITNSRLTGDWRICRQNINNIKQLVIDEANKSHISFLPDSLLEMKPTVNGYTTLKSHIQTNTAQKSELICNSLRATFSTRLSSELKKLADDIYDSKEAEQVNFVDILGVKVGGQKLNIMNEDFVIQQEIILQAKDLIVKPTIREFDSYLNMLKNYIESFETLCTDRRHLQDVADILDSSVSQLDDMLDEFYKSIQVYRSGVLAINGRQLAEKVGISSAIDELEKNEFSDEDKIRWMITLKEKIFKEHIEKRSLIENKYQNIYERLIDLNSEIQNFINENSSKSTKPQIYVDDDNSLPSITATIALIRDEFRDKDNSLATQMELKKNSLIKTRKLEIARHKEAQNRKRIYRLGRFALLAFIITTGVFLYSQFDKLSSPETLVDTVLLGIGINLLTMMFSGFIGHFTDHTVKETVEFDKELLKSEKPKVKTLVAESKLEDYSFILEKKNTIQNLLSKSWLKTIEDAVDTRLVWYESNYHKLLKFNQEFEKIKGEWVNINSSYFAEAINYYANVDKNLEILADISSEIRHEAITPSFKMLQDRTSELKKQMKELNKIAFEQNT